MEYDYGPEDIASIEFSCVLRAEPRAEADVNYVVVLKNGERKEHAAATLTGIAASNIAIAILQAKFDASVANGDIVRGPDDGRREWRDARRG